MNINTLVSIGRQGELNLWVIKKRNGTQCPHTPFLQICSLMYELEFSNSKSCVCVQEYVYVRIRKLPGLVELGYFLLSEDEREGRL